MCIRICERVSLVQINTLFMKFCGIILNTGNVKGILLSLSASMLVTLHSFYCNPHSYAYGCGTLYHRFTAHARCELQQLCKYSYVGAHIVTSIK
jgi:hypothetical protein